MSGYFIRLLLVLCLVVTAVAGVVAFARPSTVTVVAFAICLCCTTAAGLSARFVKDLISHDK